MSWLRNVAVGGSGGALTPGAPPTGINWLNGLLVAVGASNVEGDGTGTPCTYLPNLSPFLENSTVINNQGHGAHGFDYGTLQLTDQTAAVQALLGTAEGSEVMMLACDPAVNEWFDDYTRTSEVVLASCFTLVDFYRNNGWSPANGRRLVLANILDAQIFPVQIAAFNAALAASDWQSRADMLIDVSSIPAEFGDTIHMSEQNASDMAVLMAAALATLE